MNAPLIVWIIEDSDHDAREAWRMVQSVAESHSEGAQIYWGMDFTWDHGPKLRKGVDNTLPVDVSFYYPDIVILDLCSRTESGLELQGDMFYYKLREAEQEEQLPKSFVVLWSAYRERSDTNEFVQRSLDKRVVTVDTKGPEALRQKLLGLWDRIIEERESRVGRNLAQRRG